MRASTLAVVWLAACDRPQPLVLCHNANCDGTRSSAEDDTLEALQASLALEWEGRPSIDGVELDTMWHRRSQTCRFAHGPGDDISETRASEAFAVVAGRLDGREVAWNGDRFYVFIELKPYVGARGDAHSAAERVAHADCVLDGYERLVTAAAGNQKLQVVFQSVPELLSALVARPRWPGRLDGDVEVRLAGASGGALDAVLGAPRLSDYAIPLDVFEYLAGVPSDAQLQTLTDLGLHLCMWSDATTQAALSSLLDVEPRYVLSNDATLIRRWEER